MSMIYRHISHAAKQAANYIDGRRKGNIKSLKVSHDKLNTALLDGFEWNKIVTLAGLSGSGKSLILEQWKRDLFLLNSNEKFKVLSFEFEMLGRDQIARNVSGQTGKSTKELFSANGKFMSDEEYSAVLSIIKEISNFDIYYVDNTGTVEEIKKTILNFAEEFDLQGSDTGLIITLDHVLLTKGKQGEQEKSKLVELYDMCMEVKKFFDHNGMKILFLLLSQLNRDIESPDRVLNSKLHYPQRSDIFGSSHVFFSSDVVIVSHRPAKIPGIKWYGLPYGETYPQGLPIKCPEDPSRDMIYWHVLKNRSDDDTTLMMVENFKESKVIDYETSV